jgi:nucleotide-binding universal stress UspA family protein
MSASASILVGVDFSDCSRSALGHALRLGRGWGVAVNAVNVVEAPDPLAAGDPTLGGAQREVLRQLAADAEARWAAIASTAPGVGRLPFEVVSGDRLAAMRRSLERHAAELLVLGAYGETRPNVGLGTLASGCIRGLATDVLVVRDTFTGPFRTVVAGVDFSATSRRALEAAARVAEVDGARLYAVHVVAAADGSTATQERLAAEHGPALEAFVAGSRLPAGLELRCEVFPYPGRRSGLLEFGAVVDTDLVAIGTRGRTSLRDVVLGSTAEKLLRDSLCAVWAAKPREDRPQFASSQPVTE